MSRGTEERTIRDGYDQDKLRTHETLIELLKKKTRKEVWGQHSILKVITPMRPDSGMSPHSGIATQPFWFSLLLPPSQGQWTHGFLPPTLSPLLVVQGEQLRIIRKQDGGGRVLRPSWGERSRGWLKNEHSLPGSSSSSRRMHLAQDFMAPLQSSAQWGQSPWLTLGE